MNSFIATTFILVLGLSACTHPPAVPVDAARIAALEKRLDEMKPGFGEIMGVVQQHHAKLYFAGSAQNWELADYQIDEIKEGLEDVAKYYPTFKEAKLPIKDLIPKIMNEPLAEVTGAIHKKDKPSFIRAYGSLTKACNACHQAAEHGFIVIQIPKGTEFTNQKFSR